MPEERVSLLAGVPTKEVIVFTSTFLTSASFTQFPLAWFVMFIAVSTLSTHVRLETLCLSTPARVQGTLTPMSETFEMKFWQLTALANLFLRKSRRIPQTTIAAATLEAS